MLTESEILNFIQEDKASETKQFARVGLNYYEGLHDILNYKLYYYNADGVLVEDKTRSNIKISHPFFTELVDQEVQYMLSGKGGFIKSDLPELQSFLNEYFNENDGFLSELYEVLTGAIAKGFDYMYCYKNAENKLAFEWADSMGVVEVESKYSSDRQDYIIYWYIEKFGKDRKPIKRIQVWDKSQTYFYSSEKEGEIILDPSTASRPNPRPHVLYKKRDNDPEYYYETLGFIPFFAINANMLFGFDVLHKFFQVITLKAFDNNQIFTCILQIIRKSATHQIIIINQ